MRIQRPFPNYTAIVAVFRKFVVTPGGIDLFPDGDSTPYSLKDPMESFPLRHEIPHLKMSSYVLHSFSAMGRYVDVTLLWLTALFSTPMNCFDHRYIWASLLGHAPTVPSSSTWHRLLPLGIWWPILRQCRDFKPGFWRYCFRAIDKKDRKVKFYHMQPYFGGINSYTSIKSFWHTTDKQSIIHYIPH